MDIGIWLRSLGLERYEAAFRENEITEKVLPNLTAEDLKELGVAALGHRRTLLDAIASLPGVFNARIATAVAPDAAESPPTARNTAERRQVTVMFSDLVGSTALSARMDPEDLREVISAYQKCVAEAVERFGGFVAKYMGDGVLIYFGYPQAHEDDAERAVRAGLELIAVVGALKSHASLQTRVGIATGLVVVGDLIGSGASQEQAIVGETPNLAARLQSIAEPNSLVIADNTRKLVGKLFELEDLGARDLKGIEGLVRAWAALRPSSVESRFEALHATELTQLVGREEEVELLMRRWGRAKSGEGSVVLLSGEAGIGKSRLTAALLERFANESHTRIRSFCSPQHTDSAFYPIIGQMERAAALTRGDSLQTKLDKLDALLGQSSTSAEDAALLAEMLSLPNDGRYPALELTSQQRRQRTLEAVVTQIAALSRQKPLLMIFEDAHWSDPTTLELFGRIVDRIPTLGALLIVTFRPEFEPPWIGRPYVTPLTINRLAGREVGAIIDGVIGNKMLPASIRHDIIERTDGIPLFVEEMTRAVLEAKDEETAQRTVAAVPSPSIAVPPSLHASLMARLDRLGASKEIVQIGSAIGREFPHALLAAVVRQPEREFGSALDRIIRAGLLLRQGVPPHASYLFKHALIQDAAYSTLLREPKRALHARIAETLEREFPDIAENQPEILARHCTEARLIVKAAELWGKAGQRSLERSALFEAVAQFTRALDQIVTLPGTPALRREQIKLQVALITPLLHIKGQAAPETKAAVERAHLLIEHAEGLGESPEDPLLLFVVLYGIWVAHAGAFNGDAVRELAAQFLTLAEKQGAPVPLLVGHRIMGVSLMFTGNLLESRDHFDRAVNHFDQAIALYDAAQHRAFAAGFGQDPGAAFLAFRSLAQWLLGYGDRAAATADQALEIAQHSGQVSTLMYVLFFISPLHLLRGDYAKAGVQGRELLAIAEEKAASFWIERGTFVQGCILASTGKPTDAVRMITSGLSASQITGTTFWLPLYESCLANAYAELGQFGDAWRCIAEATTAVEATKERMFEAEVHRIAGEVSLKSPEPDVAKAQAHFERALAVARQQQAKSWELRASMSLARLWRDQGKVSEARELLAPVYGWFTEGFDTRDLKGAKALLGELAA
jgi:class 3 adenylate cyclase/predicted ATPase